MDLVRLKSGLMTLEMNDSKGIEVGKMEGVKGTAANCLRLRCKAKVVASAAKAGGLSDAQQLAILGNTSVNFTVLDGQGNPFTAFKELPLTRFRHGGQVLLEKDVEGLGAATGLEAALVVGTNFLTWDSYIPLGHIEFLNEWGLLGGVGDEQMRSCSITIKTDTEPLKGGDATVELQEVTYELYPDTQETPPGAQSWAVVPHHERLVNSDDDEVETKDGLILFVSDVAEPLADTLYTKYRVKVGGHLVIDDPSTPEGLEAWFEKQPDSGTVEKSISLEVTPLFRWRDCNTNDLKPGKVRIKQINGDTGFDLSYWYLPLPSAEQERQAIMAMAQRTSPGKTVHAVNKGYVHGLKVKSGLRPFLGFYVYDAEHQTALTTPGVRCAYGEEPEVFIPPTMLFKAGQEYLVARRLKDSGRMAEIIQAIADAMPGAVISTEGYEGGMSKVVRDVRARLDATADAIERQQAGRAA